MYSRLIGINQNDTDKSATDIARAQIVCPDFVSCVNKTINSTENISKGDVLNIKLYKGSLKAKVESVGK